MQIIEGQKFEKISDGINFDFEEMEKLIEKEMEIKEVKNKIQKLIYSLQGNGGKEFLITTVFISGFGILKVVLDVAEKKVVSFEKKSFMDFLKVSGKEKSKETDKKE